MIITMNLHIIYNYVLYIVKQISVAILAHQPFVAIEEASGKKVFQMQREIVYKAAKKQTQITLVR